jgi:hypothetical protein
MMKKILCFFLLLWAVPPVLQALAYLTTYGLVNVPSVSRPLLDTPYTDTNFGGVLTRLTDPSQQSGSTGLVHEYSRFPASNADNTKVIVQVIGGPSGGTWQVRDRVSHTVLNTITTNGDPEFSWHPTDPTQIFYRFGNEVRIFHTNTNSFTTTMTFSGYVSIGDNEEGRPSDDWRYYAAIGIKSNGTRDILVADLQTQTILGTIAGVSTSIDWVSMSPAGTYVVVMWTDGQGTKVYPKTLGSGTKILSDYSHSDFAYDLSGNEVLVYIATSGAQIGELGCPLGSANGSPIAMTRLSTGAKTILLGDCWTSGYASQVITGAYIGFWFDVHFSGIGTRTLPGWILVSTFNTPTDTQQPFAREIFWLKMDGSGAVQRLAHHHSDPGETSPGVRDYYAEPHATSSWDRAYIFFASTWGVVGSHYDLFSLTQPSVAQAQVVTGTQQRVITGGSTSGVQSTATFANERYGGNYVSLKALVDANVTAGSPTERAVIDTTLPHGSAVIVPSRLPLEFRGAGQIDCGSAGTLSVTVQSAITAPETLIFKNCPAAALSFTGSPQKIFKTAWFDNPTIAAAVLPAGAALDSAIATGSLGSGVTEVDTDDSVAVHAVGDTAVRIVGADASITTEGNNTTKTVLVRGHQTVVGAQGQASTRLHCMEVVTVGSGLTTKATSTCTIPADATVISVPTRVLVQPGGTTLMTVMATTQGTFFQKGTTMSTVATTTNVGNKNTPANYDGVALQTVTLSFYDASGVAVATTDALGQVRVDIFYETSTPPAS